MTAAELKKDTRRDLGKRLVNREKAVWAENGWIIESNLRWVWTKAGMRQVTITDYFGLYDFLAAWPAGGIMALVQVSRKAGPASTHKPPLGFQFAASARASTPDDLLIAPRDNPIAFGIQAGVYEIYVYYRKLKSVHAGEWAADRRWWVK